MKLCTICVHTVCKMDTQTKALWHFQSCTSVHKASLLYTFTEELDSDSHFIINNEINKGIQIFPCSGFLLPFFTADMVVSKFRREPRTEFQCPICGKAGKLCHTTCTCVVGTFQVPIVSLNTPLKSHVLNVILSVVLNVILNVILNIILNVMLNAEIKGTWLEVIQ